MSPRELQLVIANKHGLHCKEGVDYVINSNEKELHSTQVLLKGWHVREDKEQFQCGGIQPTHTKDILETPSTSKY